MQHVLLLFFATRSSRLASAAVLRGCLLLAGLLAVLGSSAQTTLGTAGIITTIPPGTYSGNYHVLGDIYLENGTYLIDQAQFEFDGIVKSKLIPGPNPTITYSTAGAYLIIGANADVTISRSTLAATGSGGNSNQWGAFALSRTCPAKY